MRVVLVTYGSDGDTVPMVALARGLSAAGHDVRLLADESGAALAAAHDVAYDALPGSIRQVMESDGLVNASMRRGRLRPTDFARAARVVAGDWLARIDAAAADADVIVGSSVAVYHAISVGESRGIVRFAAGFQPYLPTAEWPSVLSGVTRLPRVANRPFTAAINRLLWLSMRGPLNAGRARLGQPPIGREWLDYPALGAWSPSLVPTPADWATHRDGHRLTVTGDWRLPRGSATPPQDVAAFLAAGEAPLYVGFGSMTGFGQEARLAEAILAAADGRRVLLATGWAGLGQPGRRVLRKNVLAIGPTPHEWLFPRCAAVVHHCGAGTSHSAARAGVGTIPVPIVADQPFWAKRLRLAGVAAAPIDRHHPRVADIAQAIEVATGPAVRERAAALAVRLAAEDGIAAAVAAIESAAT